MNGDIVRRFEEAFAEYVGAEHAIAMCNGTATLHVALEALKRTNLLLPGAEMEGRVAVPPLTMSSTTIAVLHAGMQPVFCDVNPRTWLMHAGTWDLAPYRMPVSLYGLHARVMVDDFHNLVDDAAQTLRPHGCGPWFTSYSFQASKILSTGEGGMLVTNDAGLARIARSFSSLGYAVGLSSVIPPSSVRAPGYVRHHMLGWNYRLADPVAREGLLRCPGIPVALLRRRSTAAALREVSTDVVAWLAPQHVPDGWTHDYWTFAVAADTPELARELADAVERHGGERPYAAWRLTYEEPAFAHLRPEGGCPVAEDLQPRLLQFQTNGPPGMGRIARNVEALARAVQELDG